MLDSAEVGGNVGDFADARVAFGEVLFEVCVAGGCGLETFR
jgi:hypothetical protein